MSDAMQETIAKMKTSCVAIVLLGLITANSAFAQEICAGAEGESTDSLLNGMQMIIWSVS
jgi:hypothetical protein